MRGIEPMVTLHHFTLPAWLAERGGILADGFARAARRSSRASPSAALGDLCRLWVTINEPNVLAAQAYLLGEWPPGAKSPVSAVRAHHRLLEAHVAAYRAIKDARGNAAQVGVAHHLRVARARASRLARRPRGGPHFARVFNEAFATAICEGRMYGPLDALGAVGALAGLAASAWPRLAARRTSSASTTTRATWSASPPDRPGELFCWRRVPTGAEVSDLGWEIYPAGLGLLVRTWARRSGVPVYVTENGIADAADGKRAAFLVDHLAELGRAIADGVDVRGYFHWSLTRQLRVGRGLRAALRPLRGRLRDPGAPRARESARVYAGIARARAV